MSTSTSRALPERTKTTRDTVIAGSAVALGFLSAVALSGQLQGASTAITNTLTQISQWLGASAALDSRVYWYMSRSAGIVAYLLLWASVMAGIGISSKLFNDFVSPQTTNEFHKFTSILAMIVGAFHGLILLGDSYMNFSLFDILIPFKSAYQPFWVGLGILGFYLMAMLVGSFYIKKRMGYRTWRLLHYSSFAMWIMTTLHGVLAGTDTSTVLMKVVYTAAVVSVGYLLTYRIATAKSLTKAPGRTQARAH
jgi:predicted ferric reductase